MNAGVYYVYCESEFNYPDEPKFTKVRLKLGFWELENNRLTNIDYTLQTIELIDGEEISEAIRRGGWFSYIFDDTEEYELLRIIYEFVGLKSGEFYDRIYKPVYSRNDDGLLGGGTSVPNDRVVIRDTVEQFKILIGTLDRIFRVIYPCETNFECFGFEIRNLIILICSEVESQFRGVLNSNNVKPLGKRFTTKDYFKLKEMMKLDEFEVEFERYPELGCFAPFLGWESESPSKSLIWYFNYHLIKHDRKSNYESANLKSLLESLTGLYVLILAEYGVKDEYLDGVLGGDFKTTKVPVWKKNEMYFLPKKGKSWERRDLGF